MAVVQLDGSLIVMLNVFISTICTVNVQYACMYLGLFHNGFGKDR